MAKCEPLRWNRAKLHPRSPERQICEEHLEGRYELEVIDFYQ